MLAAAQKIHDSSGGYGVYIPTDLFGYMPFLLTSGAAALDPDWKTSSVASAKGIEAATFTRMLVETGLAPEPGGTFDRYLAFMQDDLAMLPAGRWPVQSFWAADYDTSNVGIVPFPSNGASGSPVGFSALGIYKDSDHKDAAWQFVKYTLSEDFSKWHASIAFDASAPVRLSLADSPEINQNSPEGTQYLYEALDGATLIPGIEQQAKLEAAYTDVVSQILAGTLTPEAGLTQLQETINGIL
jgi:multiple sugar transport system substrate-binding protein